jgi:outer membrane protein assembly factor BamB
MRPRATRRELLTAIGAATVTAAAGPTAAQRSTGGWTTFGFDAANTAYNPGARGPDEDPGPAWQFETDGSVESSPAVVDGTAYVGSDDGNLYAIDAASGERRWTFDTGERVRSSPTVIENSSTESGTMICVGNDGGSVYALDPAAVQGVDDGVEWRVDTEGVVVTAPAVAEVEQARARRLVFVGSGDGRVYALDAATGEEEWRFETGFAVRSSPAVARIERGERSQHLLYVGSDDGRIYALDAATGEGEWRFETVDFVRSAPAVATGDRAPESGPTVYVGSNDGGVYALDAATGERRWSVGTGASVTTSPAVRATGETTSVYVGSRDFTLYALDGDSGEELWTFETDRAITAPPAVGDGVVYAGNAGTNVFGVDADSGEQLWVFETGARIISSPAVVGSEDGTVYVGSNDQRLYALQDGETAATPPGDDQATSDDGGSSSPLQFLVLPLGFLGLMAAVGGAFLVAKRAGVLGPPEDDPIGYPDDDPDVGEDTAESADSGGATDELPVWEVVRDDVIRRAAETNSTATEDLLVTKYVDPDTLESPMVAYEIESYRDEQATIRIVEDAPELSRDAIGQLPGSRENWGLVDDSLVFETTIEPGEKIETLVARRDIGPDDANDLLDRPDIRIGDG